MEKYYLMAIEEGDTDAIWRLADYYKKQRDYINMEKYYIMSSEHGDSDAMFNLGQYYYNKRFLSRILILLGYVLIKNIIKININGYSLLI